MPGRRLPAIKNRCILLTCLALIVGVAPSSAQALDSADPLADTAKRKRTVLRDCSGIERPPPRVKPKRIACGAVGEAKVSLRVYRIRICDGKRAYTRLRARFTDFRGERNGYRLSLETHWAKCSTPRELRATFATCGPISIRNIRDGDTTYWTERTHGNCEQARR